MVACTLLFEGTAEVRRQEVKKIDLFVIFRKYVNKKRRYLILPPNISMFTMFLLLRLIM